MHLFLAHFLIYWISAFYWDNKNAIPPVITSFHVKTVLRNQLLGVLPSIIYATEYTTETTPSLATEGLRLALALFVGEFAVYFVHRALHRYKSLRSFHALHHEPLTSAAQTLDSSLGEVLFLNILAPFLPFVLFGCSPWVLRLFICLGTAHAVATHSKGLKVAGVPYDHHEQHHTYPKTNFSTFGFADIVMGTATH